MKGVYIVIIDGNEHSLINDEEIDEEFDEELYELEIPAEFDKTSIFEAPPKDEREFLKSSIVRYVRDYDKPYETISRAVMEISLFRVRDALRNNGRVCGKALEHVERRYQRSLRMHLTDEEMRDLVLSLSNGTVEPQHEELLTWLLHNVPRIRVRPSLSQ